MWLSLRITRHSAEADGLWNTVPYSRTRTHARTHRRWSISRVPQITKLISPSKVLCSPLIQINYQYFSAQWRTWSYSQFNDPLQTEIMGSCIRKKSRTALCTESTDQSSGEISNWGLVGLKKKQSFGLRSHPPLTWWADGQDTTTTMVACSTTFTTSSPYSHTIHSHYVITNSQRDWPTKRNAWPMSSQDQPLTVVVTCTPTHPLNSSPLSPAQSLASQLHYQQIKWFTNTTDTGYTNLNLFREQADVWVSAVRALQWNRNLFIFLIFCWPCISIYLFININQLDAPNFIISLFQASTCFEHMCSTSGGQKLYILYRLWYHHTYRWPSGAQIERVLS